MHGATNKNAAKKTPLNLFRSYLKYSVSGPYIQASLIIENLYLTYQVTSAFYTNLKFLGYVGLRSPFYYLRVCGAKVLFRDKHFFQKCSLHVRKKLKNKQIKIKKQEELLQKIIAMQFL